MPLPPVPSVVLGYIRDKCRLECPGVGEMFVDALANTLLVRRAPVGLYDNQGAWHEYGVTHLQKRSRFGFLWMTPFCLHLWFMWHPQEEQPYNGGWIPNSERGVYLRSPGYRWQGSDGAYVKTKGYAGLHWD